MKSLPLLFLFISSTAFSSETLDCNDATSFDEQCQALNIEKTEKMIIKYQAVGKQYQGYLADVGELDCDNVITTIDMNVCKHINVKKSEIEMIQYLIASLEQLKKYKNMAEFIDKAQQSWFNYREKECDAMYQQWIEGTIRGVMAGECQLQLTKERTHVLWRSYLTYMDSSPPVLPEPKF